MERYITDAHGVRTAVILDIEDFKALMTAVEAANDTHAVDDDSRQRDTGKDEMVDRRDACAERQPDNVAREVEETD